MGYSQEIRSIRIKKAVWNQEFRNGKWGYLDQTSGNGERDILFALVEKYCDGGKILDLGCGTGKLSTFFDPGKYQVYVGVDISNVAIQAARLDCTTDTESHKKYFTTCDIKHYLPDTPYDVILFVESLYYIDRPSVLKVLNNYLNYLTDRGVIVVRIHDRDKYSKLFRLIYKHYQVIEEHRAPSGRCSIVFKARETQSRSVRYMPDARAYLSTSLKTSGCLKTSESGRAPISRGSAAEG